MLTKRAARIQKMCDLLNWGQLDEDEDEEEVEEDEVGLSILS